jgi:hypothetical protein
MAKIQEWTEKPNSRLLPVEHPAIKFLANKGHQVRSLARRKHFPLANEKTTSLKLACTFVDNRMNQKEVEMEAKA